MAWRPCGTSCGGRRNIGQKPRRNRAVAAEVSTHHREDPKWLAPPKGEGVKTAGSAHQQPLHTRGDTHGRAEADAGSICARPYPVESRRQKYSPK